MSSLARSFVAAAALAGAILPTMAADSAEAVATRGGTVAVAGLWCGAGLLHSYALDIAQQYNRVQARLTKRDRVYELTGHMDGPVLRADPQRNHTMDLLAEGNELRIIAGSGILALAKGQFFTRAVGGSCRH